MPRVYDMSWEGPPHFRWVKMHRGTRYRVTCHDLACPPPWTQETTYTAANAWWAAKRASVDSGAPPSPALDPASVLIRDALRATPLGELRDIAERGQAAQRLLRSLDYAAATGPVSIGSDGVAIGLMDQTDAMADAVLKGHPVPLSGLDNGLSGRALTEGGRASILTRIIDRVGTKPVVEIDRTVGGQIDSWLKIKESAADAGEIDAGRYGAYRAAMNIFREWIGGDFEVTAVTPAKLEEFHSWLMTKIGTRKQWLKAGGKKGTRSAPGYSADYAASVLHAVKMFAARLADHDLVKFPPSLAKKLRISRKRGDISTFSVEEVRGLLTACDGYSPRMKLCLLLMVNCGFYQSDISDLNEHEIDWQHGTITRSRSKTPDGPTVTFPLWPETTELLKSQRNTDPTHTDDEGRVRVLVTAKGGPLVASELVDGTHHKTDNVQSAYRRLILRTGVEGKPLKLLRKTSATLLEGHEVYGRFVGHFLGHSPRTMKENHYARPSQKLFDAALAWLRERYLGDEL